LEAFILEFPVYRTYVGSCGISQDDRAIIDATIDRARANWSGPDPAIFDVLRDALTLDLIKRPGHSAVRVRRFAAKVQQFTGPMMAKSLEDTAFYRYHRLLALNEVGGNPAASALPINEFHDAMQERALYCPHGLTASATHDTKRGEDARARLLGLSELAEDWAQAVQEWQSQNAHLITGSGARRIPSPAHETMLYQALLGAWPLAGIDADFIARMQSYAIKAAREGKEQTSWIAVDETYEAGLRNFLGRLLDRDESARFVESFTAFVRRAALIGALKSLAQVTLKLTVPGVPDIYQGTELWDLSLVDPDNRRSVDFASRSLAARSIPDEPDWRSLVADWTDGRVKLALTRRVLAFRKQAASVFTDGSYRRLEVTGPHRNEILAFARVCGRNAAVVIVGTLFARATENGRKWPQGSAWDASLITRDLCAVRNMLAPTGDLPAGELPVSQLFTAVPVAVLEARQGG
jgi:(1->4)-alpha-D-glucan 1-alpha-D-glucosylmutase